MATGEAPLRENLAAGILRLAGWTPDIPLLDPMCGSGTILLEAAHMALDIAPGLGRHFAFEKFKNFDARRWRELVQQAAVAAESESAARRFMAAIFPATRCKRPTPILAASVWTESSVSNVPTS